ncbi:MAG: hypothetical protein IJI14_14555 [Anaerolineaceae bacterium]|nr:hypothetical protein [Anaerolineaceae bacterium]
MKKFVFSILFLVVCLGIFAGVYAEGVHHDTLMVAFDREPKSLLPYVSNDTGTAPLTHQYFESLLAVDKDMNLKPCLAVSWEMIDELSYRFHLREGVKFQDGSDFTAADVLYTLEQFAASPATSSVVPIDLEKTVIEDDHTIVIATKEPTPGFLKMCSLDIMGIVQKAGMEADPDAYAQAPIGTGPFKFVEWVSGDHIKLEANKDWWGGEIAFDTLMIRIIPESATRAIEAENGGVDIARITIADVPAVAADPNVNLLLTPILNTSYISFNCSVKPFDDPKVRQAISLAVDTEAIVYAVYGEYSEVARSFVAPTITGYYEAQSEFVGYDPDKAKALLTEAGYPNGFECTMVSNGSKSTAEMIQAQLAEIGIDVKLNVTDFSNWLDAIVNGKQQMYIGGWTVPSGDATEAFNAFDSANFGTGGNRSFYANPDADALLQIIYTEMDESKRAQACADLQQLLADEAVTIGLNIGYNYWVTGKNVSNFEVLPTQSPNYAFITFAK